MEFPKADPVFREGGMYLSSMLLTRFLRTVHTRSLLCSIHFVVRVQKEQAYFELGVSLNTPLIIWVECDQHPTPFEK